MTDTGQLLAQLKACLAVVRSGRTPRAVLGELAERIPSEKTLGFFLNHGRQPAHGRRHHRSSYYTQGGGRRHWWSRSQP